MKALKNKHISLLLGSDLLDRLYSEAKKQKCSINSLVEKILIEAVYKTPNEVTKASVEEVREGKFAGKLEMTDLDTFKKCIDEIH